MCGLIGLVLAYDPAPPPGQLAPLETLAAALEAEDEGLIDEALLAAEAASRGWVLWGGFIALSRDGGLRERLRELSGGFRASAALINDQIAGIQRTDEVERRQERHTRLLDLAWRLEKDAVANAEAVASGLLAEDFEASTKLLFELYRLQVILNNLSRLEVRGRDSGGIAIAVHLSAADFSAAAAVLEGEDPVAWRDRRADLELRDGAIVESAAGEGRVLLFARKVAREVGKLGENIDALRAGLQADRLLQRLLAMEGARVSVIAHNRWASNGIINQPNCHPLDSRAAGESGPRPRLAAAALNGDIDNFPALAADWAEASGRQIAATITTDAKIIPLEIESRVAAGASDIEAFREAAASFEGSYAIAALSSEDARRVLVAQRGSGQGLYIGLVPGGGALFASELYGVVELCERYLKLDGEKERRPGEPASRGEMAALEPGAELALRGLDGAVIALDARLKTASITTRDINRAEYEHYLLKEINEAPESVRKTLRGRLSEDEAGRPRLVLGPEVVPPALREDLAAGRIRRIYVIGQGTAAIAAAAVAACMDELMRGIDVRGLKATELSGFLQQTLGEDSLVVAVSQSGTTTDTNRTVDLARGAGARVLAIVNRRGSDLAFKSDGVLYTSDGRDIEMSVASTKAFYCQVTAGYLLAYELARAAGFIDMEAAAPFLQELADLPRRLRSVLAMGKRVRGIARDHAARRRYWAVVGSGAGRLAAEEIRIKLSELCYKSMSADTIEDKKHIDLSAEALIFVCAAGLSGATALDAVKEIGIFKAHNALPIVVCDRGETRFSAHASAVVEVPPSSPRIALLLNAMVGHLYGYYAALTLNASALALRRVRELVELALAEWIAAAGDLGRRDKILRSLRTRLRPIARPLLAELYEGRFNSGLAADLAVRLGEALRLCLGQLTADALADFAAGRQRQLEMALASLTAAIDELTRPIDAIKHQAKTVTVGISRGEASLTLGGAVWAALEEAGVATDRFDEPTAAAVSSFGAFIKRVDGATVYRVEGLSPLGLPTSRATIQVVAKTGCAAAMSSRADGGAPLTGTKRLVVDQPRVHVGRGLNDRRTILIVPLIGEGILNGLGLVHVAFRGDLNAAERAQALKLTGRYEDVRAIVTERSPRWESGALTAVEVETLLCASPEEVAERLIASAAYSAQAGP